jgi:LysM repeat protein
VTLIARRRAAIIGRDWGWGVVRRTLVLATTIVGLALVACGGGESGGTSAARDLKDPKTVPTATVPVQQLASPFPAVDVGQQVAKPPELPDVYVVKPGDTPAGIAASLGIDATELLRANNIDDPRSLKVGQQLRIPRPAQASPTPPRSGMTPAPGRTATATTAAGTPGRSPTATATGSGTPARTATATTTATTTGAPGTYTVVSGDTGCAIAQKLGVPLTALAEANGTTVNGLAALQVGQSLKVPTTRGPAGC